MKFIDALIDELEKIAAKKAKGKVYKMPRPKSRNSRTVMGFLNATSDRRLWADDRSGEYKRMMSQVKGGKFPEIIRPKKRRR